MALTKKYWILISLIAVFLGGTLIYFGWSKQKSKPASSQPEQINPETIRQVIIPSSLDSEHVIVDFARYIHLFGEMITREDSFWTDYFEIVYPHEGFIEGTIVSWQGEIYYVKKDGTKIEGPDDPLSFILAFTVLKYEKPEFAQKDYDRISSKQEFRDFTLKDVKLKTKVGLAPGLENEVKDNPAIKLKSEQCQQYLLQSNNFIIYAFGLKEAAEDVMIRVIDRYTVE